MKREWLSWFKSPMHDSGRSLEIIRVVVATILITHPLYAFLHPVNIRGFGQILSHHGLPLGIGLAWGVMFFQATCSLALLARRFNVSACSGLIAILGTGIVLIHAHAPSWRTVGLPDGDQQPGPEFSVLIIASLFGVIWAHWHKSQRAASTAKRDDASTRIGLRIIGFAAPALLMVHPLGALRNAAGLNDLGAYLSSIGYPFGVFLIWTAMYLQIACSIALIFRRFVVPASIGHIYVLCTGIWLAHTPYWFVIGPKDVVGFGREGMEYSVLLISCFLSLAIAYWPSSERPRW